ncbi:MAG: AmmeMemoRadiSam system protein B [Spirochaetaceae bacterium]|nr:AmmeMemoRadiSam system protein B [Spirochaetaceae bacterium]
MTLRKRCLPPGWYPQEEAQVRAFLRGAARDKGRSACAAVAPHAGWAYSGAIAARAFAAVDPDADTIALIGGHLPAGSPALFAEEDGLETPLGPLEIDHELRSALRQALSPPLFQRQTARDRYQDNTVEVLLPMAAYFFPRARLLPLRLPEEAASFEAGKALARLGKAFNRRLAVIGSTDLTHYGEPYGFTPQGTGSAALEWVREVNDKAFIEAVLAGSPEDMLRRAVQDRAACSAGAVLGAAGFALASGAGRGELLAYSTSADGRRRSEYFVGYAAIAWRPTGDGI